MKFNVDFLKVQSWLTLSKLARLRVADLNGCFDSSCYDDHVRRDGKSQNIC